MALSALFFPHCHLEPVKPIRSYFLNDGVIIYNWYQKATRDFIPLRQMLIELSRNLGLPKSNKTTKCTIFEDNEGARELATNTKYRPRTKHIAVKYHLFCKHVHDGHFIISRLDTKEQLADILTKPLPKTSFEYLRKKIQGWLSLIMEPPKDISEFDKCYLAIHSQ